MLFHMLFYSLILGVLPRLPLCQQMRLTAAATQHVVSVESLSFFFIVLKRGVFVYRDNLLTI